MICLVTCTPLVSSLLISFSSTSVVDISTLICEPDPAYIAPLSPVLVKLESPILTVAPSPVVIEEPLVAVLPSKLVPEIEVPEPLV